MQVTSTAVPAKVPCGKPGRPAWLAPADSPGRAFRPYSGRTGSEAAPDLLLDGRSSVRESVVVQPHSRPPRRPIVQLAATASMVALPGRRTVGAWSQDGQV